MNSAEGQPGKSATVIACEVMRPEIEAAAVGGDFTLVFMDQGLHRTPKLMPDLIQEQINLADPAKGPVILGYGLCSNGLVGLKPGPSGLVVGRCHDCIAYFLGSPEEYKRHFEEHPGTYYLTRGWAEAGKDPLTVMVEEYTPKYGEKNSDWVMKEELKHYTRFCLINTGSGDLTRVRELCRKNCEYFAMEYHEAAGNIEFFKRLLNGPWLEEEFIILKTGQEIDQNMFF